MKSVQGELFDPSVTELKLNEVPIIAKTIRRLLKYKDNDVSKAEIDYWLDRLEGKQ